MGAASDGAEIVRLSKEYAELKPVVDAVQALERARADAPDLEVMTRADDPEMAALARRGRTAEFSPNACPAWSGMSPCCWRPRTRTRTPRPFWRCAPAPAAMKPPCSPAIFFACTSATPRLMGGRWRSTASPRGEVGGYNGRVIASITGDGVFGRLKFESGVHRVQRVPDTETQGRIHTSAATVAVLPEVEDVEIEINDGDLRIDTYRASGSRRPARPTRPIPPSASLTCPPASWSPHRKSPSTRTAPGR